MNEDAKPSQRKSENYGRIALLSLAIVALRATVQISLGVVWEFASDIAAVLFLVFGLMWLKEKLGSKKST